MNAYRFRLVVLAGRFAETTVLPSCTSLQPQDLLELTVAAGVTPVQAVQDLFARHCIDVPERAIRVLDTAPEQGAVLQLALAAEDVACAASSYGFEVQRSDAALAQAWTTGRVVEDFFSLMGAARARHASLLRERLRSPSLLAAVPA